MTDPAAQFLAGLPGLAFAFMLLLARFGALLMVVPGLGESQFPVPVRVAFAFALCLLLMPSLAPAMPPVPTGGFGFAAIIAAELSTGLWFGLLARLVALALPGAATIISFMTGLSSILAPDPTGAQISALSRLFNLVPALLILISGLYIVPLSALVASYTLIPPGAMLPAGDATQVMVHAVATSFALAIRLAAPFILAGTVWQITLGIIARLIPSLQVYMLAMPGQVLGGVLLLAVTVPALLAAWMETARTGLVPLIAN